MDREKKKIRLVFHVFLFLFTFLSEITTFSLFIRIAVSGFTNVKSRNDQYFLKSETIEEIKVKHLLSCLKLNT